MGRKPINEAVAAWYRSIPYSRVKLPDAQLDLLRYVPAYKRAGKKKKENRVNSTIHHVVKVTWLDHQELD